MIMAGTFKNPPPGVPCTDVPEGPGMKLGQDCQDLDDPVARKNFRVVIIRPFCVDRIDYVKQTGTALRERHTLDMDALEWKVQNLWP
jgi:pyridoxamine 5'-phosphate oxidase